MRPIGNIRKDCWGPVFGIRGRSADGKPLTRPPASFRAAQERGFSSWVKKRRWRANLSRRGTNEGNFEALSTPQVVAALCATKVRLEDYFQIVNGFFTEN
jgi:hypothetical protein